MLNNGEKNITRGWVMTNFEKLVQEKMKDPEFAKGYLEEKLKLDLEDALEMLKQKVLNSESKEEIVKTIDSIKSCIEQAK